MMENKAKEHKLDGESRYTLVMVAAKRARQLVEGAEPKVNSHSNKPVIIALDEIAEGMIDYKAPETNGIK
ncbi:MAG: DNA-directed RNA polymerase subunit omega [Gudongella sp.]|jgi:DNA-directed RNA polymerase subunit omega|nr:DNA-directed RNA polymerase subunit omega [Gudongella sp.]